ncbi:MAG: hypothetical protein VW268_12110 [Rhodospirillaceae bacterium]
MPGSPDDIDAILIWLDRYQGPRPDGVDLADPAAAAAGAAQAARDHTKDLTFDADPAGFTRLLESYARK